MFLTPRLLTRNWLLTCTVAVLFSACATELPKITATSDTDPYRNTMPEAQQFEIDADDHAVLRGKDGTLIVFPKGSLLNGDNEPVTGHVTVDLMEALHGDDMILANLTTTSGGKLLESGGMMYFNATQSGSQLKINPEIPVYVEIPTPELKPGMKVYKGIRDAQGNMDWVDPQPLKRYLTTVPLDELNFYPEGFEEAVENGLPFRNHTETSPELVDSLHPHSRPNPPARTQQINDYKSGTNITINGVPLNVVSEMSKTIPGGGVSQNITIGEGVKVDGKQMKGRDGIIKSDDQAIANSGRLSAGVVETAFDTVSTMGFECTGISPVDVTILKDKRFANTFIATREFEMRVQACHKIGCLDNDVLDAYTQMLDRNLWEADQLLATLCKEADHAMAGQFQAWADEKLTNVENPPHAEALRQFLKQEREALEQEIAQAEAAAQAAADKLEEEAAKLMKEYAAVLEKREAHRMTSYGFERTEFGWNNVDAGVVPKTWGPTNIIVTVDSVPECELLSVYLTYPNIKSIFGLESPDNRVFTPGGIGGATLVPKRDVQAVAVAITSGDKKVVVVDFHPELQTAVTINFTERMYEGDTAEVVLRGLTDNFPEGNSIAKDIEYKQKIAAYHRKKQQQQAEYEYQLTLWNTAFACCIDDQNGNDLFTSCCAPCHRVNKRMVGPALAGKVGSEWSYAWVKDPVGLIQSGDGRAIKIYNDWYNVAPGCGGCELSGDEITEVFEYITVMDNQPQSR